MRRRVMVTAILLLLVGVGWWLGGLIGARSGGGPGWTPPRAATAAGLAGAGPGAVDGPRHWAAASWLDHIPTATPATAAVILPGTLAWTRALGPAPRRARTAASTAWVVMSETTFDRATDLDAFRELTDHGSQLPGRGFRIENGRLRIDLAKDFKALAMPMDESGDIRLTFDLEVDPGQEAGDMTVFWGACEPFSPDNPMSIAWNGYEAKLGAIARMDHTFKRLGRETLETSTSEVLQRPGIHAVQIEQNGGELRMLIDGRQVLTTMDGDPLDSGPGAQVGILGNRMTGWIDNWAVHRPVTTGRN